MPKEEKSCLHKTEILQPYNDRIPFEDDSECRKAAVILRLYVQINLHRQIQMEFSESLKKNRDFLTVYRRGTSKADRYLVMYVMKNGLQKNRVGISASKKVGNSVVRHTLTRRVREAYRLQEKTFRRGYDLVFVVRAAAAGCRQADIARSVHHLSKRHSLLEEKIWIKEPDM